MGELRDRVRKAKTDLVTKTDRALEEMGEGMGSRKPRKPAAAAKPKPKEKRGVGKDTAASGKSRLLTDLNTRIALMRKNLAAAKAAGNTALAGRLAGAIAKNEANKKALAGS
jgi:hypothetical protein